MSEKEKKRKKKRTLLPASIIFLVSHVYSAHESVLFVLQLQLGVDESYTLLVAKNDDHSIIGEATIEVNCGKKFLVLAHI